MSFLKGLTKLVSFPIKAVAEIVDDLSANNSDESMVVSLATLGISSVVKGTAKAVKEASEEIFDN